MVEKMCRQLRRRVIAFSILGLSLSPAFAQEGTYQCAAKDAAYVTREGVFDRSIGQVAQKIFDKVVFDIPGGHIFFPAFSASATAITFPAFHERMDWKVEKTTLGDGYVLFPSAAFHLGHSIANGTSTFIRLYVAPDEQMKFMGVALSYVITGTCQRLK